jgi:hypothetical protein
MYDAMWSMGMWGDEMCFGFNYKQYHIDLHIHNLDEVFYCLFDDKNMIENGAGTAANVMHDLDLFFQEIGLRPKRST